MSNQNHKYAFSIETFCLLKPNELASNFETECSRFSSLISNNKNLKDKSIKYLKVLDLPFRFLIFIQIGLKFDANFFLNETEESAKINLNFDFPESCKKEIDSFPFLFEKFNELSFFEARKTLTYFRFKEFSKLVTQYEVIRKFISGYQKLET